MSRRVTFDLEAHNHEIDRVGSDVSWESPNGWSGVWCWQASSVSTKARSSIRRSDEPPALAGPLWVHEKF